MNSLAGKKILSTRPKDKSDLLRTLIEERGGSLFELPMISIKTVELSPEIKSILNDVDDYNWILFTSAHGVHSFFALLKQAKNSYSIAARVRTATIGEKTAKVLEQYNVFADYINTGKSSADFADEMMEICHYGEKVLHPTGSIGMKNLQETLKEKVDFERFVVYENTKPESYDKSILNMVLNKEFDAIVFTSPSCVDNFVELVGSRIQSGEYKAISIGPTTTKTMQKHNITPFATAEIADEYGIVECMKSI